MKLPIAGTSAAFTTRTLARVESAAEVSSSSAVIPSPPDASACTPPARSNVVRVVLEVTKVKVGGRSLQGYRADHLADAWARYLPSADDDAKGSGGSGTPADWGNRENTLWPAEVPQVPEVPDLQPRGRAAPGAQPPSHPPGT